MTHPLVETVAREIDPLAFEALARSASNTSGVAHARRRAAAALSAILSNGYAIVPVEPTEEMCEAALNADWGEIPTDHQIKRAEWSAMLSSAPKVVP